MIGAAGSSGQSRDFGLLFTDPSGFFSEGKRDCTSIVETMKGGAPAGGKRGIGQPCISGQPNTAGGGKAFAPLIVAIGL